MIQIIIFGALLLVAGWLLVDPDAVLPDDLDPDDPEDGYKAEFFLRETDRWNNDL